MGYAARVMRGLMIDHARETPCPEARRRVRADYIRHRRRGVRYADESPPTSATRSTRLPGAEPSLAELVELKFFCGFKFAEIAAMPGVCERTVQRHWRKARIYLHRAVRNLALEEPA